MVKDVLIPNFIIMITV